MASVTESLKDINLTKDEVERFSDALKKEEFRKMLVDYVEEMQSPETQKEYEKEITELERQRGVNVTFVKPTAGYVIKTSGNGEKKVFINVCSNDLIEKPTSNPSLKEGVKGSQWQIPHSLTPPRDDVDNKGKLCKVYDFVCHSSTLTLAQKNKQFKEMLNNITCQVIESSFNVILDKKNLKFPKIQYKGRQYSAVIRKLSDNTAEMSEEDKEFVDKLFAEAGCPYKPPPTSPQPKQIPIPSKPKNESKYATPKYTIKHRSHIEMEQFVEHKAAKMNSAIPKELVIEIILPLLKSASNIILDVNEKTLNLTSEKPAKYKLSLTLPYEVNENLGNAKFDNDQKKLTVTLPVKRNSGVVFTEISREDSGVESDYSSIVSYSPEEIKAENGREKLVVELSSTKSENASERTSEISETSVENTFLDSSVSYDLPEFTCHVFENIFAFTLHVKNVTESSLHKDLEIDAHAIHLKFTSISSGFFPINYAFYFKLPNSSIEFDKVTTEVWDNNVVVQIPITCDTKADVFFVGIDKNSLSKRYVDDPSVINKMFENKLRKNDQQRIKQTEDLQSPTSSSEDTNEDHFVSVQLSSDQSEDECTKGKQRKETKKDKRKMRLKVKQENSRLNSERRDVKHASENADKKLENMLSNAIDIVKHCESSGDELSCSYSPHNKGILKNLPNIGRSVSRSMSESSIDEIGWASSVENCYSIDSVIPEEEHASTSLKKTVRFNDVVSKQVFRSNSSILGQRKKNQRKAKAKKRAQERKYSESELSESEEKKEKAKEEHFQRACTEENTSEKNDFSNDIFLMDIDF